MQLENRWEQRFQNFSQAFQKLAQAQHYVQSIDLNTKAGLGFELMKQGMIQSFEFTHELAWNVMKDYAYYQGTFDIKGSRDATREALKMGLIEQGDVWMDMIRSRNQSSHTYEEATADLIFQSISTKYVPAFFQFQQRMESLQGK